MGLTVTRTPGQQILLQIEPGTTAEQLLEELQGGIMITLIEYRSGGLRINIQAPKCLTIARTAGLPLAPDVTEA
jgi:hypothetical protein